VNHENKSRLLDFHFQEGPPRRSKRTRKHLESCPDCREELRGLVRTERMLAAWPDERPAPETFDRILASLPEARPRVRPEPKPQPLLPLAGIAGGMAFIMLVLLTARGLLARFSFWERLQAGWLAKTFGDFGLMVVGFILLSGLAALSLAPFLFDYARKSDSCHDR
jgi:anti-sigma factor RsiW